MLFVHERSRTSTHSRQVVGESEIVKELLGSHAANRQSFGILAQNFGSQGQATIHKDQAIPHPNEEIEKESRVRTSIRLIVRGKKLVGVKPREEKREKAREAKALRIAEIEKKIKSELLDRLKKGIYDKEGIVNLGHFKEVLEEEGISDYEEGEEEEEGIEEFVEDVSDIEDFNLELEDAQFNNFEDDLEESDDEEEEDDDDESDGEDDEGESPANKKRPRDGAAPTQKPKARKGRKGASMRIEYEEEDGATRDLSLDW